MRHGDAARRGSAILLAILGVGVGTSAGALQAFEPAETRTTLRPAASAAEDERVVFHRQMRSGGTFIFTAEPDGTDLEQLTLSGRSTYPRWSPSGDRIAYTRGGDVWLMNADGTSKRRVLENAHLPSWAPDGRRLLVNRGDFSFRHRFGVLNLQTKRARWYPLTRFGVASGADWSPRNNRILFTGAAHVEENNDIYAVSPDFAGLRRLTRTPRLHELWPRRAPAGVDRLAYTVQDWSVGEANPCLNRLVVLDLTDNVRTRVRCDAYDPAWSPDGNELLLSQHVWDSPDHDLVRFDLAAGTGAVVLPHTEQFMTTSGPDWR